jgi:hypothetical protein
MSYPVGQTLTDQATFKDANGDLYNPTTVTVTVRNPDGTLTTPTATNVSLGVYRVNIPLGRGITRWVWDGVTGAVHDKIEACACAAESVVAA